MLSRSLLHIIEVFRTRDKEQIKQSNKTINHFVSKTVSVDLITLMFVHVFLISSVV